MESQEHDMMNDDDDEEYDEEERLKLEFKIKTFLDKASEMDTMYDTVTGESTFFPQTKQSTNFYLSTRGHIHTTKKVQSRVSI